VFFPAASLRRGRGADQGAEGENKAGRNAIAPPGLAPE